ncbi:hypothetical protein AVEN_253962-1 [Araneus ventricosus]|uniref:Uncharacterized protein n=1 Tax=Araneus ventricosus TaxID=182803 RepID=A0A4Y2TEU6_ARAVE|nr:hypothetical protein AVEN_253962-1 [Araneus ventricosus]
MRRTTSEPEPPSPNFCTIPAEDVWPTTYDVACNRPHHGIASAESSFKPGTLRLEVETSPQGHVSPMPLGWSMTGHPKKRSKDAKMEYMNTLQKEIEERKKKEQEDRLQSQEPGAELASIIRKGAGGRPRKDPITGELLPNPRKLTDVTEKSLDIRRAKSQESLIYFNELSEQAEQRQRMRQQQKLVERAQSEKVSE